ncbi:MULTISPECIES: dihydrofolate reductase family protein [Streptomyces]|uniref:Dihydrofolate reductase family protein n=1 Tax=Streptomyces xanthii TaxID=2768069 RepID=A0A7H1BGI4_9ACTN|nr:dihydrofolate reductase family protein [Streptomyces xanthii]QNS07839.1 dihydrofolate reductase family protein [Streptomyces xanthii]
MRKIILMMGVSLDGYTEGPGRDIGWHQVDDALHRHMNEKVRSFGGLLTGRVTHELMASYWPAAGADPDSTPTEVEFAAIWRDIPKIVFSRTLPPGPAPYHSTVVSEVLPEAIRALKEQPGGDLNVGGADLAATFLAHDLIDEFHTYVHPVLIGTGTPLFPVTDFHPRVLRLAGTQTFDNGVVLLRHARVPE